MKNTMGFVAIVILVMAVLWAGCTGISSAPADLKYRATPGDNLSYQTTTITEKQNTTDIGILDMKVVGTEGNTITWDAVIRTRFVNGTTQESPLRFSTNSRGVLNNIPLEKQIALNLMTLPGTLVYPENPVVPGDTWTNAPAFNGTMNVSDIPVEYRYTAQNTYTYLGNGTIAVPAGTFDGSHILQNGTSHLTFTMPIENKTVITSIDGTYAGDNWVRADNGYLVSSDYETDTTTIIDASSMTGDPLGLSMMGSTSHSRTTVRLQ
jgi:hypothetical protein